MPRYEITSPDGKRYEITAPEGASEKEVLSFAESQWKAEATPAPKVLEPEDKPVPKQGLVRQALQGLTFGTSDEIGAAAATLPAALMTWQNPKKVYGEIHQQLQDDRNQFKAENPKSALAAELLGGLATGGAGATKMATSKALSGLGPLARTMVVGATEGGIYGGASADRGERAEGAGIGAASGAVLSPVTDLTGQVVKHLGKPLINKVKRSLVNAPEKDATRYLAEVLAREGMNVSDLNKASRSPMTTIADVSEGGRGTLEGVLHQADNPGIKKMAREAFDARNAGQQSRIFKNVQAKFGIDPEMNVKGAVKEVGKRRTERAAPLYKQAESKPIVMTQNIKAHLDPKTGTEEVLSAFQLAERRMATRKAAGETVNQFTILDEMKKNMDDQIETLWRGGSKRRAGDLIKIKNSIIDDIDAQNPAYKQARSVWAGESALIDAAEHGKKILKEDVDFLDDIVEAMGESEKEMFRLGAMKAIREKLMAAREGTNSVNRIASELNLDRMKRAFPTDEAFNEFKKDLKFEASIFETSRVLHNSMTAMRLAEKEALEKGGAGEFVEHFSDGPAAAIGNTIKKLFNSGLTIESKQELGKMLLTPLGDLPPNVLNAINKKVMLTLPTNQRTKYMQFIQSAKDAASGAPTALPAIGIPVAMNGGSE